MGHVHDGGPPLPGAPRATAPEQGLIKAERPHRPATLTVGGQQRLALGEQRPVHRMPVTPQLGGHIGDRAGVAIVAQRPASDDRDGAICSSISVNEPTDTIAADSATATCPHEPHRASERQQIHQLRRRRAHGSLRSAAIPTGRSGPSPDVQHRRSTGRIIEAQDLHTAETDDQLTEARSGLRYRGLPSTRCYTAPILETHTPPSQTHSSLISTELQSMDKAAIAVRLQVIYQKPLSRARVARLEHSNSGSKGGSRATD